MASEVQQEQTRSKDYSDLLKMRLDEVTEPGAYVCPLTGDLIRLVRSGAMPQEREAELLAKHGAEPIYVARISNDPFIPISKARIAAANLDVDIHF